MGTSYAQLQFFQGENKVCLLKDSRARAYNIIGGSKSGSHVLLVEPLWGSYFLFTEAAVVVM